MMMTTQTDETDEKPLDPVLERVRQKMMRLMLVSVGIMMVGLIAVLIAVVYKTKQDGVAGSRTEPMARFPAASDGGVLAAAIPLPAGAVLRAHTLSGDRLSLHVALPDGREQLIVWGVPEGRVIGRFDLVAGQP